MNTSTGIGNAHKLGRWMVENGGPQGSAYYGIVGAGREFEYLVCSNRACHAQLRYIYPEFTVSKIVDVLRPQKVSREIALLWYSFILERSAYSSMFAERKAKRGMDRGYFIYHADVNSNIMVAGAVAVRMATEKPDIVRYFYDLVMYGTDEDVAFLAAHSMCTCKQSKGVLFTGGGYEGHVAIAPIGMYSESARRYFKADIENFTPYSVNQTYRNINKMFGEGEEQQGLSFPSQIYNEYSRRRNGKDNRVALFNLDWNRTIHVTYEEKEVVYPILSKILNEYKQEILRA